MKFCINGGNVIRLLFLLAKVLKFEIQKCSEILCAHKPYFLMPGHIFEVFCHCVQLYHILMGESYSTMYCECIILA